ncbi:MAG TPA: hypothetical protein DFS52_30700 [Myxococcales bacterium]|jgi:hypothetical protein|nr:hypothetical protein [Myxococcales bacterium]
MTTARDPVWHASRLVQWGLRPLARPAQEAEYRELVERYFDDGVLRNTVRELADGLGLHVLDVSEHGVVLAPMEDSIFALKPADFRPGSSKVDDRLLDGLAQVAIAATVFPRARDLDEDPDIVRSPVTVDEVETQLRQLCERLSEEARGAPDPSADDERRGLTEAWRVYMQRLDSMETRDSRKAMRATRRIIEYALDRLREFGCFTQVRQGSEVAWQPTRRYQVIVQQLAGTALFQLVRDALNGPTSPGEGEG